MRLKQLIFILLQFIVYTGCASNNDKISLLEHIKTSGLVAQQIQLEDNKQLLVYVTNPDFDWIGDIPGGGSLPNSTEIYGNFTIYLIDKSSILSVLPIENLTFYFGNINEHLNTIHDLKVLEAKNWDIEGIKYCFTFEQYSCSNGIDRSIIGYSIRDRRLKELLSPTFVSWGENSTTFENGNLHAEYYDNSDEGGWFVATYKWNSTIEAFEKVATTRK